MLSIYFEPFIIFNDFKANLCRINFSAFFFSFSVFHFRVLGATVLLLLVQKIKIKTTKKSKLFLRFDAFISNTSSFFLFLSLFVCVFNKKKYILTGNFIKKKYQKSLKFK